MGSTLTEGTALIACRVFHPTARIAYGRQVLSALKTSGFYLTDITPYGQQRAKKT